DELVPGAIVPPGTGGLVPAVVPGPGARGEPDLPGGRLPVQDEARAVLELHRDEAVARGDVEVLEGPEPAGRALEARIGGAEILLLVHGRSLSGTRAPCHAERWPPRSGAASLPPPIAAERGRERGGAMIEWSEQHLMIRDMMRRFIDEEIKPKWHDLQHRELPPYHILRQRMRTLRLDQ